MAVYVVSELGPGLGEIGQICTVGDENNRNGLER